MLTATLLGDPGVHGVVVGPLKHASEESSIFQVSSGTRVCPQPCLSHQSNPASQLTNSELVPVAFITSSIASTSSGPVPSPRIRAILFANYDFSLEFNLRSFIKNATLSISARCCQRVNAGFANFRSISIFCVDNFSTRVLSCACMHKPLIGKSHIPFLAQGPDFASRDFASS